CFAFTFLQVAFGALLMLRRLLQRLSAGALRLAGFFARFRAPLAALLATSGAFLPGLASFFASTFFASTFFASTFFARAFFARAFFTRAFFTWGFSRFRRLAVDVACELLCLVANAAL